MNSLSKGNGDAKNPFLVPIVEIPRNPHPNCADLVVIWLVGGNVVLIGKVDGAGTVKDTSGFTNLNIPELQNKAMFSSIFLSGNKPIVNLSLKDGKFITSMG